MESSAAVSQPVEAQIRYALPASSKLFCYEGEPPAGLPKRSASYDEYHVLIRNGRMRTPPLGLASDGFTLLRHDTRIYNFYDEREVRSRYYPEVEALVRAATGASRALVFDHNVRGKDVATVDGTSVHAPVMRAHNDFTVESAPRRARALLAGDPEQERLLAGRFLEVNVWRPIRGPLQSTPLAVCSAASMQARDFLACDLIYPDRVGEIYEIAHDPRHEWFYFPDMQREEALLLLGYDSDRELARIGAHSAFDHPHTPADALPRESIEARVFAFFAR